MSSSLKDLNHSITEGLVLNSGLAIIAQKYIDRASSGFDSQCAILSCERESLVMLQKI